MARAFLAEFVLIHPAFEDEELPNTFARRIGYIFLKRFSKAWRASVGRDGDGGGDVAVEGWEYEVGAVSFSMVMRNS